MTDWRSFLKGDPVPWLLEESNPYVRYHALTWLEGRAEDDPAVAAASQAIAASEPVQKVLRSQRPQGYWGSDPRPHHATQYQLTLLTWLGYRGDGAVKKALEYRMQGGLREDGSYGVQFKERWIYAPCHGANLLRMLLRFGMGDDPRAKLLLDWLLRSQEADGVVPCISKVKPFPCLWASGDVLRAYDELPPDWVTPRVAEARQRAVDLFLDNRLCYYKRIRPDQRWFQFGYPLHWDTDILEVLELCAPHIRPDDPRIQEGLSFVLGKQDGSGRWPCEKHPKGGKWVQRYLPLEEIGQPSKWVTLHAVRMLKRFQSNK